jgi:hypothetical protein
MGGQVHRDGDDAQGGQDHADVAGQVVVARGHAAEVGVGSLAEHPGHHEHGDEGKGDQVDGDHGLAQEQAQLHAGEAENGPEPSGRRRSRDVEVGVGEDDGRRPSERLDDRRRRAVGHHPPAVEDDDVVAQALGLLHVVGDEDDGGAPVADPPDDVPGVATAGRVEVLRQLVEEHDLGATDEGQGLRRVTFAGSAEATSRECAAGPVRQRRPGARGVDVVRGNHASSRVEPWDGRFVRPRFRCSSRRIR